jgi:hypothetical protein
MSEVLWVLASLLAMAVVVVGVMVLGTYFIVRAAVRRTRRSKVVAASLLRLRPAAIPVGTRGEIGRLRWRLHSNLRHTERVLSSQVITGPGANPYPDLLASLKHTAAELDRHLALVEREPDAALRKALLPRLAARAEQVIADSTALRGAAYGLADEVHRTTAEPLITDVRDRIVGLLGALRAVR